MPGDFDFDGKPDLMGYHAASGALRLCRNAGVGLNCTQTFTGTGPAGFSLVGMAQMVAGCFIRGSAAPALMAYRASDGALFVGRRSGGSYVFTKWATVLPAAAWNWDTGYFSPNGGRQLPEEIVGYHPSDGSLWVGKPQ